MLLFRTCHCTKNSSIHCYSYFCLYTRFPSMINRSSLTTTLANARSDISSVFSRIYCMYTAPVITLLLCTQSRISQLKTPKVVLLRRKLKNIGYNKHCKYQCRFYFSHEQNNMTRSPRQLNIVINGLSAGLKGRASTEFIFIVIVEFI